MDAVVERKKACDISPQEALDQCHIGGEISCSEKRVGHIRAQLKAECEANLAIGADTVRDRRMQLSPRVAAPAPQHSIAEGPGRASNLNGVIRDN